MFLKSNFIVDFLWQSDLCIMHLKETSFFLDTNGFVIPDAATSAVSKVHPLMRRFRFSFSLSLKENSMNKRC